jgi:hypothetical protein
MLSTVYEKHRLSTETSVTKDAVVQYLHSVAVNMAYISHRTYTPYILFGHTN